MNTNIDLFEHYDELPLKIKEIINVFNTEIDVTENAYDLCKKLVSELEIHGYTCDYGLDAEPHSLRKLETTNEKTKSIEFLKLKELKHSGQGENAIHLKVMAEFEKSFEEGKYYCSARGWQVVLENSLLTVKSKSPFGFEMIALIKQN